MLHVMNSIKTLCFVNDTHIIAINFISYENKKKMAAMKDNGVSLGSCNCRQLLLFKTDQFGNVRTLVPPSPHKI
jgi:hypothetical protein